MTATWDEVLAAQQAAPDGAAGYEVGRLAREWVIPPFSILDTTSATWRDRRRAWLSLGIESELGRGEAGERTGALARAVSLMTDSYSGSESWAAHPSYRSVGATDTSPGIRASTGFADGKHPAHRRAADERSNLTGAAPLPDYADFGTALVAPGTSIFDPVLCELAYRWWCPPGGSVLDPFAGGSVRGIVAAMLGHQYTGIDLSAAQVAANREQAARIVPADKPTPRWYTGDSRALLPDLSAGEQFDMVFTCPPYFDLEVYSTDPADLSNMGTYAEFVEAYNDIIAAACRRLRRDRLAVVVVSDVRDKHGFYVGLRRDTELAFERAGSHLYNDGTLTADPDPADVHDVVRKWDEAKLVNPVGTLAMRTMGQMRASRKLGRMHQDVLVFARTPPTTHGWEYVREAPPAPQQTLALLPDDPPAPVQVPLLPDDPPALALVLTTADDPPVAAGEALGTPTSSFPIAATDPDPGRWQYTLADTEVWALTAEARAAGQYSASHGHVPRAGQSAEALPGDSLQGAAGEYAVGCMLGLERVGYVTAGQWTRRPDLPHGIQVRTARQPHHRLWLYEDDDPDAPYVLVTGVQPGPLEARGWVWGHEAMTAVYRQPPAGARPDSAPFWVPASVLRPMHTLLEACG